MEDIVFFRGCLFLLLSKRAKWTGLKGSRSLQFTVTTLSCQLHCHVPQDNEESQSNVISSQSWTCSCRFFQIIKCPLQSIFPWISLALFPREVNIRPRQRWKHRNDLRDHMVSWEEMAPGMLVCPGTWRLRTSQGWALADFIEGLAPGRTHVAIVMTSGLRIRSLAGVNW